ncbi:MAG: mechanosensitive ion channel family protein [Nakamurella sp.]
MDFSAPACAADAGTFCQWIWDNTGLDFVATNADVVLRAVLHIAVIVVVALVVRFLAYRSINRIVALTANGMTPALFRPLRAHAERALNRGVSAERRRQRALAIGSLLKSVTSFLVVSIAAILVLAEFGINVAPLLASAGIAGVALAFGAQNLIKDFLAGIFMTLEDQYGVGDNVDLGSASGTVTAVGLRTTTVRAGDGTIWHVRNGEVQRVGNSSQGESVVNIDLPLPYAADATKAGHVALAQADQVATSPEFVDAVIEPPKMVGIVDIAPGMVTIRITATVRAGDQDAFSRALRTSIKQAFDAALAADPSQDFRPPLVLPPLDPG